MYGFAHAAASIASCTDPANWRCVSWFGKNHFTDAPAGDSGTLPRSWWTRNKTARLYIARDILQRVASIALRNGPAIIGCQADRLSSAPVQRTVGSIHVRRGPLAS